MRLWPESNMSKRINTTKRPTKIELPEKWLLVDAAGQALGRLASKVAKVLVGKNAATYDPAVVSATKVVVINAAKIKLTGKKLAQKVYYRHSTHMGGLKTTPLAKLMVNQSDEVIRRAVSRMLPKNSLRKIRLDNLKVYADEQHRHIAQQPTKIEL
ncbi:MAG: 50S ribosomal protein L13 [candidate division Kazan bacterium GW2011_GWA1_44_22]|uniref:Large ribosomal subunit protein uL13 n=2 Tax=Bacteria division Kazan-3B-28 TaxID=1798534 RepID=A0A0G1I2A5_UNCK3|nr:MAG: 50S ribosomal protein L13 [candidate division Kazan bacterium GW2011_GWA1_44_22]